MFPPHTRGCTPAWRGLVGRSQVSPAHAGMYLSLPTVGRWVHSFPRTRGDVPFWMTRTVQKMKFPPHTRGCTVVTEILTIGRAVSPAHAGMYRGEHSFRPPYMGFPRTRGDVPRFCWGSCLARQFPPHTRGCTPAGQSHHAEDAVSPAHAGMYRCSAPHRAPGCRFPRTRGDVPG